MSYRWMTLSLLCMTLSRSAAAAPPPRIVCFGDSNTIGRGVTDDQRWPAVLQSILKDAECINAGVGGRSIGQETGEKNGLQSIDAALTKAGKVDEVILFLGTNDSKGYLWKDGEAEGVAKRMSQLINRVRDYHPGDAPPPQITIVAPPPIGSKLSAAFDKPDMYRDANDRLSQIAERYQRLAVMYECRYVDLFGAMKGDIDDFIAADGVHFKPEGYKRIAELIAASYQSKEVPAPPTEVRVEGEKIIWTASVSKSVIGYEIRDVDDGNPLAYSTGTDATLPEGHDTAIVRSRDAAGNVSQGVKAAVKAEKAKE